LGNPFHSPKEPDFHIEFKEFGCMDRRKTRIVRCGVNRCLFNGSSKGHLIGHRSHATAQFPLFFETDKCTEQRNVGDIGNLVGKAASASTGNNGSQPATNGMK